MIMYYIKNNLHKISKIILKIYGKLCIKNKMLFNFINIYVIFVIYAYIIYFILEFLVIYIKWDSAIVNIATK